MATVAELVEAIHAAPRGPRVAACFDYDGTVIDGFSASAFYRHRIRGMDIGPVELARTLLASARGIGGEQDFADFLELSLAAWKGETEEAVAELGEKLFRDEIAGRLHHETWRLAEAHHAMGHTIVLASSATRFQIEPMARELGADHALCTPIEIRDGVVTGRTAGAPLWGDAKARAVRALAAEHDLDLEASFAYSNGDEDVPFLEAVGNPVAVSPEGGLRAEAERRGWPVLRCDGRGATPGPRELARTAVFYGGMAAGMGAGLGVGLLRRSRQTLVDIAGEVGSDLGLAAAGIDVRVVAGTEHLWSARPCIFVFNHQSKLDPILLMKLLRGGFTGVAKKEAANVPGFGQFFRLAGVAFIDRGDTTQAKRALAPAVAKVRDEGLSLVLAPEGTRSPTPRLGRFKKGAFHIAMQAEVPMVPIVIRNAGEVMWRGAQTLHAGTVEVAALPPVDTSDWTVATIDDHVAHVRAMFVDTLAAWPGDPQPPVPQRAPRRQPAKAAR
ncbi:MAG TPA: HAD-IB family hydrolase [Solirubrobacteraceae bacterium]|nr:HAD-IB family hydrolase [Solirubrobacteraceae bacterium]